MKQRNRVFSMLLAFVLILALFPSAAAAGNSAPAYRLDTLSTLPMGFAIGAKVVRGDENGNINPNAALTRAEGITMVIRLMGLEEEAQAAAEDPSPFTDVPAWANGYINVAAAHGIANGVGNGRFDPNGVCDQQAFITMIYRLTHLEEGTDFTWETAVDDFLEDLRETETFNRTGYAGGATSDGAPFDLWGCASTLEDYFQSGGTFTRQAAADVLYCMMNIIAGPEGESLGDILSVEYGMSDMLLFDHYIRRTAYGLRGETSICIHNFAQRGDVVLRIEDGMLYVEFPGEESGERYHLWLTYRASADSVPSDSLYDPIPLPEADLIGSLGCEFLSYYSQEEFYITYLDGEWTISRWDLYSPWQEDFGLIHAYMSESYVETRFREENFANSDEEAIAPEIQALADELTAGKTTELEKADAICEWVANHIYYEYNEQGSPGAPSSVPVTVLAQRRAVCAGYANLTLALMRAAGLKCYKESSRAQYASGHAWNVALLDGEWVAIDNTWDSPLSYFNGGNYLGYRCYHHNRGSGYVWESPENYLEPNAIRGEYIGEIYFNMDWVTFHQAAGHTLERNSIKVSGDKILDTWLNKY